MQRRPSSSSRRAVLTTLAGAGGAALLGSGRTLAAPADPRVARILAGMISVDMHSHVQIPFAKDPATAQPDLDIDLAGEMRRGGFSVVCQTFPDDGVADPADYYPYYLQALAFEDRLLARNHMRRALNIADIRAAHAARRPIIVQSVEGAQFLAGRLERLEEAHGRGLRHLQLVHERDDAVSPIGDVYTATAHLGGLTPFGAEVIKACNRLGLLVDLAHGNAEMVTGALKVAAEPLIISHTGISAAAPGAGVSADMQRRLISGEQARAVAQAGGVVGLWWRLFASVRDYVAGLKDMVALIGVDHVGIGTDTDLTAGYVLPYTNKIWADENGGFMPAVVAEMLRQGFAPADIAKICGGNFCRVFAAATAKGARP